MGTFQLIQLTDAEGYKCVTHGPTTWVCRACVLDALAKMGVPAWAEGPARRLEPEPKVEEKKP